MIRYRLISKFVHCTCAFDLFLIVVSKLSMLDRRPQNTRTSDHGFDFTSGLACTIVHDCIRAIYLIQTVVSVLPASLLVVYSIRLRQVARNMLHTTCHYNIMTGPCRFNRLVAADRLVNLATVLLLHCFPRLFSLVLSCYSTRCRCIS